jgi:hypothetical protein
MTIEELRREAGIVLAAAMSTMESFGSAEPLYMLHWPTDVVKRAPITIESLGTLDSALAVAVRKPGEWMKWPVPDGAAIFSALREAVQQSGADATLFCAEGNAAKPTASGVKNKQEFRAEIDLGVERMVRKGWLVHVQVVHAVAQTAAEVILLTQEFWRHGTRLEWVGTAVCQGLPQTEYGGRAKMFGIGRRALGVWIG